MSPRTFRSRPRLGFLGVGWIGRHRMKAVIDSGVAEVVAIADPDPEMRREVAQLAPRARLGVSFDELLESALDGVVIATPSAQHADQALRALESGLSVFCQKPLGRSAEETAKVVAAAKRVDRLLGVDMSYRHTRAMRRVRELVESGELGRVYASRLVFHNAYGPDKSWYYERALSGGGCVMDLGIHLVDLALWVLGSGKVNAVRSRLYAQGQRLTLPARTIEDYAWAELELDDGGMVEIACSWKLPAGRDAVISAEFLGTDAAAVFRNVKGSFYDFVAERLRGTSREELVGPPDAWGGRALVHWVEQLAQGGSFQSDALAYLETAHVLDAIASAAPCSVTPRLR